ncbi:hypothetical protein J7J26_03275 [Candidatus Micrarchaeota archaeon]|nr:hypothetical protein [Candidatus Micrarchaeota archaeon]
MVNELHVKLKDILGNSFIIEGNKPIKIDKHTMDYVGSIAKKLSNSRGRILSHGVELDDDLSDMISSIIFKKNKNRALFERLLLKNDRLTTMNKWKILHDLVKEHVVPEEVNGINMHDLLRDIHEFIDIRNMFAHGIFVFDSDNNFTVNLRYHRNGEKNTDISVITKASAKYQDISIKISRVIIYLEK